MRIQIALRPLGGLEHIKVWYVIFADRAVPFATYEEAVGWVDFLLQEAESNPNPGVTNHGRLNR